MSKKAIYITADTVNAATGGGLVTYHESEALKELFPDTEILSRDRVNYLPNQPFEQDDYFLKIIQANSLPKNYYGSLYLAHGYAGCLTETVKELQCMGVATSFTAAAHDKEISRREHESLGIPFSYPHLVQEELWKKYLEGYLLADVLICPSSHSANVKKKMGRKGRIEIIPHGVNLPGELKPAPKEFVVGYLGICGGPDKGLRYLLEAWKKLNYKDAKLVLAGSDSTSPWVNSLIHHFGGGRIEQLGWVSHVSDFFQEISILVAPSATEGFGISIADSMAHGRPVVCSLNAGASDLVPGAWCYEYQDIKELAKKIDVTRDVVSLQGQNLEWAKSWQNRVRHITWPQVREMYKQVWKDLLKENM